MSVNLKLSSFKVKDLRTEEIKNRDCYVQIIAADGTNSIVQKAFRET